MMLQRPLCAPDCKQAPTHWDDHVHSRARPVMSSVSTSKSQWFPAQIEDSRLEFISVLPVGLASVPLGTAPQYASEIVDVGIAPFAISDFVSCCATGMRWDLPHWCEIIKIGVPVGWCEICPLMWYGINYQPQLVQGFSHQQYVFEGKTSLIFLVPAEELQQCIEAAWLEGHPKVRGLGCVCIYWYVTYNHIASFKSIKMNYLLVCFFSDCCLVSENWLVKT